MRGDPHETVLIIRYKQISLATCPLPVHSPSCWSICIYIDFMVPITLLKNMIYEAQQIKTITSCLYTIINFVAIYNQQTWNRNSIPLLCTQQRLPKPLVPSNNSY